ncbi:MAG TPA: hypothetical protein VKB35_16135 [Ktedonobacteraceae bacterium]|nr:hypothetical protein [Ktedonobacteraceae bacterium]
MKNFWNELNKPVFILAPMEDVTDTVLRQVIARCGKPAVFFYDGNLSLLSFFETREESVLLLCSRIAQRGWQL